MSIQMGKLVLVLLKILQVTKLSPHLLTVQVTDRVPLALVMKPLQRVITPLPLDRMPMHRD